MTDRIEQDLILYGGLQATRRGYGVRLLTYGEKKCAFKNPKAMSEVELRFHFRRDVFNIGIELTDRLLVFDLDDPSLLPAVRGWGVDDAACSVARSARGLHVYARHTLSGELVRNRLKFRGMAMDVLMNGHVCCAQSWNAEKDWRYEWVRLLAKKDLPVVPDVLFAEEKKVMKIDGECRAIRRDVTRLVSNPEAYCLTIESVQGAAGSKGLVRFIAVMRDAGRTPQQTWELLQVWNRSTKVKPPWSDAEMHRALRRVYGMPS